MNIWIPLIITSIAGLATILGNILLFINTKYKDILLSFSMGLSFIVMFLISILELIPEGIHLVYFRFNIFQIFIYGLMLLFIGYAIVCIIDKKMDSSDNLYNVGFLSMLSLLLHNIPEGIICSITSLNELSLGIKMATIIMIHNIPEGICISLPIYYSTKSRGKALLYTLISSLGEILGALISIFILDRYIDDLLLSIIYIVTGGIMISLSTNKILREGISLKCYKWLILGCFVGLAIIYLTL